MIKLEYGREFDQICTRTLAKYKLTGLEPHFPPLIRKNFFRAFASTSRNTGRMTVDVAWIKPDGRLYVECFFWPSAPMGCTVFS